MLTDEQMSRWLINVTTRNSQNSQHALPISPPDSPALPSNCQHLQSWWWLKTDWKRMFICWWRSSVGEGRWSELVDGCLAKTHLIRTQTSKLCNQWVDSYLFAVVVQRDRRTVPPSMEGQGALGAMIGARKIVVPWFACSSFHFHQRSKIQIKQ